MAKDEKAAKPGRAGKATAKAAKEKRPRGERWRQVVAAFKITRRRDSLLPLWMALAFFAAFGVVLLVLTLLGGPIYLNIPTALLAGLLGLMIVFGRRAQRAAFREVEGQPGAGAWVLQSMRGNWKVTQGAAVTAQLDTVHRVLGRPGVILVGEGAPHRVRTLMAQEKKRVARISGDTPIYDVLVGDEEGQIPLRKLSSHVTKLPRNLSPKQVSALEKRLAALGGTKAAPLPKGPLPKSARMPGLERTIRRR
jgi:Domain of unknown function (DUF4191)